MDKFSQKDQRNIIETVLVLMALLTLMFALFSVLRIFLGVLTFALIFSVSFAEAFEWLTRLLGNRRKLAAFVYSLLLVAIIAIPIVYFIGTIRGHIREAIYWIGQIKANGLPPLPGWISGLPIVGEEIGSFWRQLQDSPKEVLAHHENQVRMALRHILTGGMGAIGTVVQFILAIIISAFFLVSGDKMLVPIKLTAQHLLGRRDGLSLLGATIQAIKSVSIGVMGTALIASIISWIGLAIAGIPLSLILASIIFFLVLIQLGPLLVWIPVVIWSAMQGHTGLTIFLIIYGIALLIIDAFLKPILIARSGGRIPFLVLFLGVVGGLAAWGFIGMFLGAIILAVFFTIFNSWLKKRNAMM
jgi:predicted PurR-regulated permease PerM